MFNIFFRVFENNLSFKKSLFLKNIQRYLDFQFFRYHGKIFPNQFSIQVFILEGNKLSVNK